MTANNIIVFRMSNLNCVRPRDEDEDSDIDEPEEEKPFLKMAGIKHTGCVNRVKYTKIGELTSYHATLAADTFILSIPNMYILVIVFSKWKFVYFLVLLLHFCLYFGINKIH